MQSSNAGFNRAILYAGGGLAELYPTTTAVPKGLLPVYDKPLVYYSLSLAMLAGIRQIAVVTRAADQAFFKRQLEDGSQLGLEIEYLVEDERCTPARSFGLARDFIAGQNAALVLADCLIYGNGLQGVLNEAMEHRAGATVFAHPVSHPARHTIVELAPDGVPLEIAEGPADSSSNLAITGISFYDASVVDLADELAAGGDRISLADIHRGYLRRKQLRVRRFGRGYAWLDASTHASLAAAANFIETIESTHGLKIGCPEEIAYHKGFITAAQLSRAAASMNNAYGEYLRRLEA